MKIYTDKDLSPNIQKYMPKVKEEKLFYKDYGLKHPSALYNLSFTKIREALSLFLDLHKQCDTSDFERYEKEKGPLLVKAYRDLLYCFMEHLDDCFHVVKSFVPPPIKETSNPNQYSWLKQNANSIVEDFFNKIDEYKKHIGGIVNELKHNNGILSGISFYEPNQPGHFCLGYFVCNVVNGAFQPVDKIHTKIGGASTAFSFRRDLNYNLYHIYYISEEMMILLREKVGIDFESVCGAEASENMKQIFRDLMDIPRYHFPDEYTKPVPSISFDEERVKLEYPSPLAIKPNNLSKGVQNYPTDGHTGEYKFIYK